ncbi:alpha/beta hydrolase family domain-containing protein [Ophiocordyceps camponoti-floridani]|uniref:Alpha/beta hydrolase family domain-containing protein n=1 Tax=Ophiocordyceps camponoti-floridani TaxID=2030778 RepID=A0A8H4QEE1_9HYPO|nr:alpha/beta hydrolase family domain-containing protein [Ophiocordyceps camponoti-floridani]
MTISARDKAVLIITGYWHVPEQYSRVGSALERKGIRVISECLPTCQNLPPPHKTIHDDIQFIKDIVAKEVEEKTLLTVLCHSYGGMVASAALGEFAVNAESSNKGGVTGIIYMSAFVPSENQSLSGKFGGRLPEFIKVRPDNTCFPEPPAPVFFSDLSPEDADWAIGLVTRCPVGPLSTPIPGDRVAWRSIPSAYIFCEADVALPPKTQRSMVAAAKAQGAKFRVYSLDTNHSPFVNKPEAVADIVVDVIQSREV